MRQRRIVFHSIPDYSGNARAIYEYAKAHHPSYDLTWLAEQYHQPEWWSQLGIACVPIDSFGRLLALTKADLLVTTHGIGFAPQRSKYNTLTYALRMMRGLRPFPTVLNLGHGRGPKGTGNTSSDESQWTWSSLLRFFDRFFISKSLLLSHLIAASYAIHPSRIFVTGEPRNDWLLEPGARARLEGVLDVSLGNRTAVLYAPTFRDDDRGHSGGGDSMLPDNVKAVFDSEPLARVLEQENAICVLKLHPRDERVVASLREAVYPPLHVLHSRDLHQAGLDLYEVLGGFDLLITDYSSLYMDFLLLDRPVLFYVPDLARYGDMRGFKLEPLEFWMPGPQTSSMDELVAEVGRSLSHPERYRQERHQVASLVHRHRDAASSGRAWDMIETLLRMRHRLV